MQRPSIKQIAERCGVSHATVSMALHSNPLIKAQTRERIVECANRLNYRPNQLARSLKLRSTKVIGFVLPSVMAPFNAAVTEYLYQETFRQGYNINIHLSENDPQEEMEAINEFLGIQVDGLIIQPAVNRLDSAPQGHPLHELERTKFPCVLWRARADFGLPVVTTDGRRGSYLATCHLLEQGYRELRFLYATNKFSQTELRKLDGFRQALTEFGIPFQPSWSMAVDGGPGWETLEAHVSGTGEVVRQPHFNFQKIVDFGYELARAAIASTPNRPLGLVCSNDELAAGAWGFAIERRLDVPGEIGIAGFDDTLAPRLPLTSIRWKGEEIARKLVGALLAQIRKEKFPFRQKVGAELIVRKSTTRFGDLDGRTLDTALARS